jgi:hypothetical protein
MMKQNKRYGGKNDWLQEITPRTNCLGGRGLKPPSGFGINPVG